jgi:N-acetylmuramoyl-L-alanine amidase
MIPIEMKLLGGHGSREGHLPIIIVNHVTVGGKGSVINTFSNLLNKVSSTFLNCRDGSIVQFCDITQRPKTNGNIRSPRSSIVKQMGNVNPNLYSVTIENEDAINDDTPGVDGRLTEPQFYNLCWLHKYIQTEVKRIYGNTIPLNSSHVIGHRDIDSVGKGLCPGNNFPMARLLTELSIADSMTLEAYEERLLYLQSTSSHRAICYAFTERIETLGNTFTHPKYGNLAKSLVMRLEPILAELGYVGEVTPEGVVKRVISIYKNSHDSRFEGEAFKKLTRGAKFAQENGIMPS